jgi:hypothetical protein
MGNTRDFDSRISGSSPDGTATGRKEMKEIIEADAKPIKVWAETVVSGRLKCTTPGRFKMHHFDHRPGRATGFKLHHFDRRAAELVCGAR